MIKHVLILIIMKRNLLEEFKHYGGTSERQTGCFKIVKLRRTDKLFTDFIFAYFRMLKALFNFPKWMNLFGFRL